MEASESEKVIQRLNQELQEANEQANSGKHKCVELQGKEGSLSSRRLLAFEFVFARCV